MTDIVVTPRVTPKRRPWRWQFSLRTFLLVTVVAGGIASWVASTYWREETKLPGGMVLREQLRPVASDDPFNVSAPHGRFMALDKFGRTRAAGSFHRGKPVGSWAIYHENGRTALAGKTREGQRTGKWSAWNPRGSRVLDLPHDKPLSKHAQRGGPTRVWHSQGVLKASGPFRQDSRDGNWTFWNETGEKVAEGDYRNGVRHGAWTTYNASGTANKTWYLNGRETPDALALVAGVMEKLKSDDRQTRLDTVQALGSLGSHALPALQRVLESKDEELVCAALRAAARLDRDAEPALPVIRKLAAHSSSGIKLEALLTLYALDETKRDEIFSQLLAQFDLNDPATFSDTGRRLAELARENVPLLANVATAPDQTQRLRSLAVAALLVDFERQRDLFKPAEADWWQPVLELLDKAAEHDDPLTAETACKVRDLWSEDEKGRNPRFWPGGNM